jgi:hypothetical protein
VHADERLWKVLERVGIVDATRRSMVAVAGLLPVYAVANEFLGAHVPLTPEKRLVLSDFSGGSDTSERQIAAGTTNTIARLFMQNPVGKRCA